VGSFLFKSYSDWYPERLGSVQFGEDVLVTRPLRAIATLPWPPEETRGMVARLGELEQRPSAGRLIQFDAIPAS
jgi:hypothetical protein